MASSSSVQTVAASMPRITVRRSPRGAGSAHDEDDSFLAAFSVAAPIASGAIRREDVRGDLYDLIGGGVPGRTGPDDITFFKNAGGGHLDLMTAQAIMAALDDGP